MAITTNTGMAAGTENSLKILLREASPINDPLKRPT